MNNTELLDVAWNRVRELNEFTEKHTKWSVPPIRDIRMNLRGACGGKAEGDYALHLNPYLMDAHFDHYVKQTIGHEYVHCLIEHNIPARATFRGGKMTRWPKPHGPEWKNAMVEFGLEPERTHQYDVSVTKGKSRPFMYACGCQAHSMTKNMHNKISGGDKRYCRRCKKQIVYVGSTAEVSEDDKQAMMDHQKTNGQDLNQVKRQHREARRQRMEQHIGPTDQPVHVATKQGPNTNQKQGSRKGGESKRDQAVKLVAHGFEKDMSRKEIIDEFLVGKLGMTPKGASTYYHNAKKQLGQ